jgi:hypothetical protein
MSADFADQLDTGTQPAPEVSPEALWLAGFCTENHYSHPKLIGDGRYACVMPFLFTHAIITGRIGNRSTYEDRWCYATSAKAIAAIEAWDGTGEPVGWHRHPGTGRRRTEDGEEYITP